MRNPTPKIHPWESLWLFGTPGAILLWTIYVLNPFLVGRGFPLIWSFSLSLYGVLYALLVAAIIGYRRERSGMTFAARMRLHPLSGRDWLWTLGAVVLALLGDGLLEPLRGWMAATVPLPIPAALPSLFDPWAELTLPPTEFMGTPLPGNLWVVGLYAVAVFGNIIGEELWWRGYLLPRQEQVFGRWAWLINGLLWIVIFHAFMWWSYPTLLATGLLAPYMAQRLQNTWASILIHGTGNVLFLVLLLMGVYA